MPTAALPKRAEVDTEVDAMGSQLLGRKQCCASKTPRPLRSQSLTEARALHLNFDDVPQIKSFMSSWDCHYSHQVPKAVRNARLESKDA